MSVNKFKFDWPPLLHPQAAFLLCALISDTLKTNESVGEREVTNLNNKNKPFVWQYVIILCEYKFA